MRRMAKVFKPRRGEAYLDTPTIAEVAPLPARHERGEGWGEGLVPSNYRALLKSPLPDPTSPSWGEGIDCGLGGGIMRPWVWSHRVWDCPPCAVLIPSRKDNRDWQSGLNLERRR